MTKNQKDLVESTNRLCIAVRAYNAALHFKDVETAKLAFKQMNEGESEVASIVNAIAMQAGWKRKTKSKETCFKLRIWPREDDVSTTHDPT